jgi:hypothetical protein
MPQVVKYAEGGGAGMVGACGGAGALCCEVDGAVSSVAWNFVGESNGAYDKSGTYNFVGQGCGAYEKKEVVTYYGWKLRPCCMGISALLLILAIFWWFHSPPLVTTPSPLPPKDCIIFGDPHIHTFDGMHSDYYTPGEYWIVRSEYLKIQGKYQPLPITGGLSVTVEIAVSGALLGNNVLRIGALSASYGPTKDQQLPILQAFNSQWSDPEGLVHAQYNGAGALLQNGRAGKAMHVVHVQLAMGIELQVNRWNEAGEGAYINVKIHMPPMPGQDGHCGNFNGISDDDNRLAVRSRVGTQGVAVGELLFSGPKTPINPTNHPDLNDVRPAKLYAARMFCKAHSGGGMPSQACIMDYCFGGEALAAQG